MLEDKSLMGTRFGAAALGVLLFQDVSVVPCVVLLPVAQTALAIPGGESARLLGSPDALKLLGAGVATQLLDLGVLAVCGRALALAIFRVISPPSPPSPPPRPDVFLAMSLLTVVSFSQAAAALGYEERETFTHSLCLALSHSLTLSRSVSLAHSLTHSLAHF